MSNISVKKIHLGPAACAVDLGDGSERGEYVDQDYILRKLGRPMRGISLMYCYYPLDKGWPQRASVAFAGHDTGNSAWGYPYDDYFPFEGGLNGDTTGEPFRSMREVRRHGQEVVLTITMDPKLPDEHIVAVARQLRTFGRLLLRVNHEASGSWFSFNKRATYKEVSDFFAHVCEIFHKEAPHVKLILCLDGYKSLKDEKMEKEDDFLSAIDAADIMSVDRYLALHWGWPYDVADDNGTSFSASDVKEIYELAKKSKKRYEELSGKVRPMVLSELNADGDVIGAEGQAQMMKDFTDLIKNDPDPWLNAFTLYQFRDKGRLGLEIEDPNNQNVGIEQPLMDTFREIIADPFFSPVTEDAGEAELPVRLRWGGSEDAEGIAMPLSFPGNPVFCEAYFEEGNLPEANLMIECNGTWFYKAPGVTVVDLMTAFHKQPLKGAAELELHIYAPPASGENDPSQGEDWAVNYYAELTALPRIRIRDKAVKPAPPSDETAAAE